MCDCEKKDCTCFAESAEMVDVPFDGTITYIPDNVIPFPFLHEGRKDDQDKVRWDLMPWGPLNEVAKVMTHGAKKYSDDNWKKVAPRKYIAASMRHFIDWVLGETNDPESGLHHLAHAVCCLLFLMWFDGEK